MYVLGSVIGLAAVSVSAEIVARLSMDMDTSITDWKPAQHIIGELTLTHDTTGSTFGYAFPMGSDDAESRLYIKLQDNRKTQVYWDVDSKDAEVYDTDLCTRNSDGPTVTCETSFVTMKTTTLEVHAVKSGKGKTMWHAYVSGPVENKDARFHVGAIYLPDSFKGIKIDKPMELRHGMTAWTDDMGCHDAGITRAGALKFDVDSEEPALDVPRHASDVTTRAQHTFGTITADRVLNDKCAKFWGTPNYYTAFTDALNNKEVDIRSGFLNTKISQ